MPTTEPESDALRLSDSIRILTEETRALQDAVDELREEMQWRRRNGCDGEKREHEETGP